VGTVETGHAASLQGVFEPAMAAIGGCVGKYFLLFVILFVYLQFGLEVKINLIYIYIKSLWKRTSLLKSN
jgi:hypothetical protein